MIEYSIDNRQSATDIGNKIALQEIMRMPVRFFVHHLDYWIGITVIIDDKNKNISSGRDHGKTIMEAFARTD
jgi:hypothetical protein